MRIETTPCKSLHFSSKAPTKNSRKILRNHDLEMEKTDIERYKLYSEIRSKT